MARIGPASKKLARGPVRHEIRAQQATADEPLGPVRSGTSIDHYVLSQAPVRSGTVLPTRDLKRQQAGCAVSREEHGSPGHQECASSLRRHLHFPARQGIYDRSYSKLKLYSFGPSAVIDASSVELALSEYLAGT